MVPHPNHIQIDGLESGSVPLDPAIGTAELNQRGSRPADYEAENRALTSLMEAMANSPADILRGLAETALRLCKAHSAGISILQDENGRQVFEWRALAGRWSQFAGSTMPRETSPCATVVDYDRALLIPHPDRYYPIPAEFTPPIVEVLLVPFHVAAKPVGTIWVIAHDETRRFDKEDERIITSLGKFASTAYRMLVSNELEASLAKYRPFLPGAGPTSDNVAGTARELFNNIERQSRIFDTTLSSIADFAYIFNREGRFIYMNQALLDLWGLKLEDAAGKNFFELQYPDELAGRLQRQIQQVFNTRQALTDETPYTSPTGAGGYYEYIFTPVIGADGDVEVVAGSTRDITRRKRAEALLAGQKHVLEMLATGRPLTSVLAALIGVIEEQSSGLLGSILVRRPDSDHFYTAVCPSLPKTYIEALYRATVSPPYFSPCVMTADCGEEVTTADIAADQRWSKEWRDMVSDLELRACYSSPIFASDGRILGSLGLYSRELGDPKPPGTHLLATATHLAGIAIERKLAEEALHKSEEFQRQIVESSEDCITTLDLDGTLLSLSGGGRRRLEIQDIEPLLNRAWIDFWKGTDREAAKAAVTQALAGESGRFTGYLPTLTGKPKWWDVMITPIRDAEGRPEHLLSISREITEQKQAEEEIAQRARLAELRADINAALSDAAPLSTLLQQCAERFVERLDMAFARIWTLNESGDILELQASAGLYTHLDGPHARVKMGELKIGRIAQSGTPLLANDLINDPNTSDRQWAAREGITAFAGYPLIVAGRVLGVAGMFARHGIPETVLNELKPCCDAIAQCIQRKWAEEAVHQRTAQFETLLNEAPLGVYLIDADFRIREVNPTARAVFGNMAGLIGRDLGEVLHILWPDGYADEVIARFRHTLETGEPYIVPERAEERLDRRVREYYEWRISRIPLPEGRFGVVCYFQDISRQVLARETIAESEERLRFMAESMPQKIFTATPNGDVDYFNRQWMEFTGLSFDQIKNWGWTQFIHPDDLEENVRLWRRSIATGELFQYMHRFRRFDGVYRWHLSRAHPMRDAGGKITMWIGSNTEIHDQKRIEEELRLRNEDLNQFAYAASHDLREPLRNVANYTELLVRTRGDDPDGNAEIFKKYIVEGVARMEALLSDLLAYTQVANAEPDASVDGDAVLQKALQNLAAGIAESGAVISHDGLPPLFGQESHYVQLFQNLVGNAIKYRGEQTPRIHVGVTEKGGGWLFSVSDNGIGIERQYAQKIFGLFKRLHGKDIPGTGIGLAICSRVVERYGGHIWVESEPGQGAVFFFTLPAGPGTSGPRPQ